MHVFARLPVGAEASEIIFAQNPPDVAMPAAGAVSAEASVVPRTILDLALGVYVQERALLLVAGVEARVEITFRHLRHVVFVQKLAAVALFAQRSQPMLADDGFLFGFDVAERAKFLIASPYKKKNSKLCLHYKI